MNKMSEVHQILDDLEEKRESTRFILNSLERELINIIKSISDIKYREIIIDTKIKQLEFTITDREEVDDYNDNKLPFRLD